MIPFKVRVTKDDAARCRPLVDGDMINPKLELDQIGKHLGEVLSKHIEAECRLRTLWFMYLCECKRRNIEPILPEFLKREKDHGNKT